MCIRDRVWRALLQIPMGRLGTYGDIARQLGLPAAARAVGAVSYTHLRAHETVLDLVCRLLLEKKNTSVDNRIIPDRNTNTATQQLSTRYRHPLNDSDRP